MTKIGAEVRLTVRPSTTPGPDQLDRRAIAENEELVVYRIVQTDDPGSSEFIDSFRPRSERGLPPRAGTPEEKHPSLAEGISVYLTRHKAAKTARATRYRLGSFTAEVRLRANMGAEIAIWGSRGHLTVWGDPLILASAAADIVSAVGDFG